MRRSARRLGLLAAVLSTALPPPLPAAETGPEAEDDYVAILGTRVSLRRPPGFVRTGNQAGLESVSGDVAIIVSELPQPFETLSSEYTKERLAPERIVLLAREPVEVDGHPGFLVYGVQLLEDQQIALWIVGFGTEQQSVLLQARTAKAQARKLSNMLHETLVTARWELERPYDPFAGLPFILAGKHRLKLAHRVRKRLTYTTDGSLDPDAPKRPVFIIAHAVRAVPEDDRTDLCQKTLEGMNGVSDVVVHANVEITIDGLPGCELLAYGTSERGSERLALYQVVLFEREAYYGFQGRVGVGLQYRFLPAFKEIVTSFKRR